MEAKLREPMWYHSVIMVDDTLCNSRRKRQAIDTGTDNEKEDYNTFLSAWQLELNTARQDCDSKFGKLI